MTENSTALRHILIVDDEKNVALGLREGVETLPNCQVMVATDGEQALQLLERRRFDLLITDYSMPGVDGMTLARRVRQLHPETAIIMVTAYASAALREQANRVPVQSILDKPVRLAEIRSVALGVLGDSKKKLCHGRVGEQARTTWRTVWIIVFLFVFLAGSVQADDYSYTSVVGIPAGIIPDNGCPPWRSFTIDVPDSFTIDDLNVGLNIRHTYRGDLIIGLRSPIGTIVQLAGSSFDADANYDVLLDDESANPLDDGDDDDIGVPYLDRDARPFGNLSDFDGENAQGTWTLYICDNSISNTGFLRGWMLSFSGTPTAVELARFEAEPAGNAVRIVWETATEIDNVGFNLYRSETPDGAYVKLNESLIPSQVPGSVMGAVYTWLDQDVQSGRTCYYKLEDVDVCGTRTMHGPIGITLAAQPSAFKVYLPLVFKSR